MKRFVLFTIILALILSCRPADVLSQGQTAAPNAAVPGNSPAAQQTSAKMTQSASTDKIAYEQVPVYLAGPVHTEKFVTPPLYPAVQVLGALTLPDCYQMALLQSEVIAINTDLIKQADAHFMEALSIILPHASFISEDFQQAKQNGLSSTGLAPTKISARAFNATQTLFNGFKAIAAIKGARYEKTQRTDEKIRAEQLLLLDVSNAFYLVLEERADYRALEKIRKALDDRVKELIGREKLGKSRPSEIVYAKTQLYSVEASIELAINQELVARQLLEFLVGQPVGEIGDTYQFPDKLMPEDYYVQKAPLRPDVAATKFAWQISKENIRVVDSGFLPQVDVDANYYTQRTGADKGIDWDVMLTVNVPIFEGTEVLGRSNDAKLQADQNMQTYHKTLRQAPYDIKDAYVTLTAAMTIRDKLRQAYETAKLNAHMQIKDYDRRLVSNLDVLTAIQALENTERSYIHALYEAKRQYWQLRVAVGQSGTESLSDTF